MMIVTYHAVEGPPSPVCCPPAQLEDDLEGLRLNGFTFVTLDACAEWLLGGPPLPPRPVVITFDDGYASVVTSALPLLQRFNVPATMFVIGERINGDNQWPGQWASIPRMPLAGLAQLREWTAAGMSIGSHSWSHPRLPELDAARLRDEVGGSADRLEQTLGAPVRHFAYPYGFRGPREIEASRQRYVSAVNAEPRLVGRGDDSHDLFRIDCHDVRLAIRLRCLDERAMSRYLLARRSLRRARRQFDRFLGRA